MVALELRTRTIAHSRRGLGAMNCMLAIDPMKKTMEPATLFIASQQKVGGMLELRMRTIATAAVFINKNSTDWTLGRGRECSSSSSANKAIDSWHRYWLAIYLVGEVLRFALFKRQSWKPLSLVE
jgi:hypothetical protein